MRTTTIAIMQPYFMPYAGYFRLMAAADLFVIYDCVQFPKGGWVHRNRLPDAKGELRWLTLPIQRPSLGTSIEALAFMHDAPAVMSERLAPFPDVSACLDRDPDPYRLMAFEQRPVDYLASQLEAVSSMLGLQTQFLRASSLELDPDQDAAGRVIEIVKQLQGTVYVNAPGGRELYDKWQFAEAGIDLRFLVEYPGPRSSILHRLLHEDTGSLRAEIVEATRYQHA